MELAAAAAWPAAAAAVAEASVRRVAAASLVTAEDLTLQSAAVAAGRKAQLPARAA